MEISDASNAPKLHDSDGDEDASVTEVASASSAGGGQVMGECASTLAVPPHSEHSAVSAIGTSTADEVAGPVSEAIDDTVGHSTVPRAFGLSRGDLIFVSVMVTVILILSIWQLEHRHGWQPTEIEVLHPADDYRFTIEINSATWVEWLQLDGIGETMARRIVEHRERHGPFHSIDDLEEVHGIGPITLEKMRPHLRYDPSNDQPQ